MSQDEHLDCTRLTEQQRTELLSKLGRIGPPRADSRRSEVRYEYQVPGVQVSIIQQRTSDVKFVMHARNLSRSGISLLHGGFLHAKTRCSVLLNAVGGKAQVVTGEVVGCRHISRNIHEVCIQFFEKISIDAFCGPEARVCSESPRAAHTPRLKGLAVCLSPSDAARREIVDWLSVTGLDAVGSKTVGAMMDKVKQLPFIAAVIDGADAEWDASDVVRSARSAGYAGGIIVIDPRNGAVDGADAMLARPLDSKDFHASLAALMLEKSGEENKPIFSTLAGSGESRALLGNFVENAQGAAASVESALRKGDSKPIMESLASLKSTAGGYGFGVLGQAAAVALAALERGNLRQAERPIGLVVSLCRRLSAEIPPAKAA